MQTFISILRGINVSGQKKILMADLKTLYEGLKFKNVITYIQSGNVIFKAKVPDISKMADTSEKLAEKIEKAIFQKYQFTVPVIIRSVEEMENILASNPFQKNKNINEERIFVTLLSEFPAEEKVESLKNVDYPPDKFVISGKEVFLYVPDSYGETKLSNNFFENKLKVSATTRNWKTINKLIEIAKQ